MDTREALEIVKKGHEKAKSTEIFITALQTSIQYHAGLLQEGMARGREINLLETIDTHRQGIINLRARQSKKKSRA